MTSAATDGDATYQLTVDGHLDDHWAGTLGDLTLLRLDDGTTTLTGTVVDQAQLHGLLARVRDLGITLITVRVLDGATDPSRATRRPGPRDAGPCLEDRAGRRTRAAPQPVR